MFSSANPHLLSSQVGSPGFTCVHALCKRQLGRTGRIHKSELNGIWNGRLCRSVTMFFVCTKRRGRPAVVGPEIGHVDWFSTLSLSIYLTIWHDRFLPFTFVQNRPVTIRHNISVAVCESNGFCINQYPISVSQNSKQCSSVGLIKSVGSVFLCEIGQMVRLWTATWFKRFHVAINICFDFHY